VYPPVRSTRVKSYKERYGWNTLKNFKLMNEKLIERKLRDQIKKLGGLAIKFFVLSFTGFPDRIVLMPVGRIWFVELKSTGKKPGKRQLIVHHLLLKLGFPVWVIDTQELLDAFFREVQK
jgi:hypothetical protein